MTTPEIPESAVEAAVEAIHLYSPFYRKCSCGEEFNELQVDQLTHHIMRAQLEAALPHIREMIAEEIRAERAQADGPDFACLYGARLPGVKAGLERATEIVKGKHQ